MTKTADNPAAEDAQKHWSVVVLGHWNRAIVTPIWIAEKLFGVEAGSDRINVEVALDAYLPPRVRHGDCRAFADERRLVIEIMQPSFELLAVAMQHAVKAVRELPVTPFHAAGINMHSANTPPDELWTSPWDERLAVHEVVNRKASRSFAWKGGLINVTAQHPAENGPAITFNFERRSSVDDDIIEWLSTPHTELSDRVRVLEQAIMGDAE